MQRLLYLFGALALASMFSTFANADAAQTKMNSSDTACAPVGS